MKAAQRCLGRFGTFSLACLTALAPLSARPHGANYPPPSYPGPGDTVPPGGGGGGGGGAGPTAPPASGPTSPGPATPGGGAPKPGTPRTGGGGPSGTPSPSGPSTPTTPSFSETPDFGAWELWWHYNRHAYIDFDRALAMTLTGSDEFYLGRGEVVVRDAVAPSDRLLAAEFVPLAIGLLRTESSKDVVSAAMIALAKARVASDVAQVDVEGELLALLRHPHQEVAESVPIALGIRGGERAVERLVALLAGDTRALEQRYGVALASRLPERTRAFAAYGLGVAVAEMSPYHRLIAARALCAALAETGVREDVATACVVALGSFALPDDPRDENVVAEARSVLVSRQEQIRFLLAQFEAPKLPAKARAQLALAAARVVASTPTVACLRQLACERIVVAAQRRNGEPAHVRAACSIALGILGTCADADRQVRATLLANAQGDPDLAVRGLATVALGQVAGRPARSDGELGAAAGEISTYLLGALAKQTLSLRPWAALGLACEIRGLSDARAGDGARDLTRALRQAFADARSPFEIAALGIALGIARDTDAQELLLARLDASSDVSARAQLCLALGMTGAYGAIERITAQIDRSRYQPDALRSAALALGLLGNRDVVPVLVANMQSTNSLAAQGALASALARVGDARAVAPLIGLARDSSRPDLARAFAVVALGALADPRARPWNFGLSTNAHYADVPASLTEPLQGTGVLDIL